MFFILCPPNNFNGSSLHKVTKEVKRGLFQAEYILRSHSYTGRGTASSMASDVCLFRIYITSISTPPYYLINVRDFVYTSHHCHVSSLCDLEMYNKCIKNSDALQTSHNKCPSYKDQWTCEELGEACEAFLISCSFTTRVFLSESKLSVIGRLKPKLCLFPMDLSQHAAPHSTVPRKHK